MFSSLTINLSILISLSMGVVHLLTHYVDESEGVRAVIGAIASLAISTLFINRYVTSPLNTLTRSMRLLEKGDSNAKLQINGSRQMRALAESFNLMVDRVMQLVDSTAQQIFDLAQSQERVRYNATLEAVNVELEKSLADVKLLNAKQEEMYMSVINSMVSAIEASDKYTHGHSERVTRFSLALAVRIHLPVKQQKVLKRAAILHDIGKIGVDKSILHKQGKLTDEEFLVMRQHPEIGMKILQHIEYLAEVLDFVGKHHERFDGKGYPNGISSTDIPIEARIMAIADTFDAMTSDRPYRKGLPLEIAIQELVANAGTQFDPELVREFIALIREGDMLELSRGSLVDTETLEGLLGLPEQAAAFASGQDG